MVSGDYHYTATSVARRVGMIPAGGKVMIIQAESELRSLHTDSFPFQSQREAYTPVHSPPGRQLERGAGAPRAWGADPISIPQRPPPHLGAEDDAHVQSAKELHAGHVRFEQSAPPLRKAKSELGLSTTAGPQQQPVGHPLLAPQHDTRGVSSHTHGWSSHHQLGNHQRPAHGLGSGIMHSHGSPRDDQGITKASVSPQGHPQGDGDEEEASGQRLTDKQEASERAPGEGARAISSSQLVRRPACDHSGFFSPATEPRQLSESRQWQHADALPLPPDDQLLAGQPQPSAGHPQPPAGHPQQLCQGLRVTLEGRETAYAGEDALQALISIAQGRAQCCVTGPAFAHMLGQADRGVLDMVLQNVVVFARMQSHQKGQVMELLGAQGLHVLLDGQQHHIRVATCYPIPPSILA